MNIRKVYLHILALTMIFPMTIFYVGSTATVINSVSHYISILGLIFTFAFLLLVWISIFTLWKLYIHFLQKYENPKNIKIYYLALLPGGLLAVISYPIILTRANPQSMLSIIVTTFFTGLAPLISLLSFIFIIRASKTQMRSQNDTSFNFKEKEINKIMPLSSDINNQSKLEFETTSSIEDAMLKIYIGKKFDYYHGKWAGMGDGKKNLKWNWAAFFFGIFWLGYRKMYLYAFIYIVIVVLLEIISHIFQLSDKVSSIYISAYLGIQGNYLYYLHANKKIKKITTDMSSDQTLVELAKAGGSSIASAIGAGICTIIILVFTLTVLN